MSNFPAIPVYVINMEKADKRWTHIQKVFAEIGVSFHRIEGIDGQNAQFAASDYSERSYQRLHGRKTNPPEVGCYLSHLKALRAFLESGEELAMICEDDIILGPDLSVVLSQALAADRFWNLLHLTGLSEAHPLKVRRLTDDYWLCINLSRFKGAGAYVIDRKAAQALTNRLLPMKMPYDHAIDREWFYGFAAGCVLPFPVIQRQRWLGSSIQTYAQPKLTESRRWLTTYPYQAFNEISRLLCRSALYLSVKLRGLIG